VKELNLEYFKGFLEAVKQKSLAKASEKLNITHPALSKQIRKLEEYYGVTLFTRSAMGVELTDAGHILHQRIQPILSDFASLQLDLLKFNEIRRINLGTLPSLAAFYLPQIIYNIEEKGIEVDISVKNTSNEILEQLNRGEIQAAIIECESSHRSLWSQPLFSEPYYAVVPQHHKYYEYDSIDIRSISNEPLVLHPPVCNIRKCVTKILDRYHLKPNLKTEVDFGDFILGYVATGAGITIVPEVLSAHVSNFGLKAIRIDDQAAKRTISLVTTSEAVGKFLSVFFKKDR
jgi:LysR family transcriptional activator of glutamate synthase operon